MHCRETITDWSALLFAGLLASACGASQGADSGSEAVGEIEKVIEIESYMDGDTAYAGNSIPEGARLHTDDTGIMKVHISSSDDACMIFTSTDVTATNDDKGRLGFGAGLAACRAVPTGEYRYVLEDNGRSIAATRPSILRVGANEKGSGVLVLEGEIQVVDLDDDDVEVVSKGGTFGWNSDGSVNPKWRLRDMDGAERAAELELVEEP